MKRRTEAMSAPPINLSAFRSVMSVSETVSDDAQRISSLSQFDFRSNRNMFSLCLFLSF